jgi:4-diphosphocytidyl-2-C-methyl-D-erythritol kinase
MIRFPNCKLNLGLQVTGKRSDQYHDLETVFYPLAVQDILEIISAKETTLHTYGLPVPGDPQKNLCIQAWKRLKEDYTLLPSVAIHLYKNIPMGAGLGGGSSDGASMLCLLNNKFDLQIDKNQLLAYALELGSDCPFFIKNVPCFATGRGEQLEPIDLDLSGYSVLLVNPGIHVDTRQAFSQIKPSPTYISIKQLIREPIPTWKKELKNNFEIPVFRQFPILGAIKQKLYEAGALYASMSGSGSTIFGIFGKDTIPTLSFESNFRLIILK